MRCRSGASLLVTVTLVSCFLRVVTTYHDEGGPWRTSMTAVSLWG